MENFTSHISQIKDLRINGKITAALSAVNSLIKQYPQEEKVILEAMKTYLFADFAEQAIRLFGILQKSAPDAIQNEIECQLRLKIFGADFHLQSPEKQTIKRLSKWCQQYFAQGIDPCFKTEFTSLRIQCFDGTIHYTFGCTCPSCAASYSIKIHMTLLLWREYLCPHCFARLLIEFELIKSYLKSRNMSAAKASHKIADIELRRLQFELDQNAMNEKSYPLICRNLSQDYVFLVNQFIINRLIS